MHCIAYAYCMCKFIVTKHNFVCLFVCLFGFFWFCLFFNKYLPNWAYFRWKSHCRLWESISFLSILMFLFCLFVFFLFVFFFLIYVIPTGFCQLSRAGLLYNISPYLVEQRWNMRALAGNKFCCKHMSGCLDCFCNDVNHRQLEFCLMWNPQLHVAACCLSLES